MAGDLRTGVVIAGITAVATVGGTLGGTYLGSSATLNVAKEQLRHDDKRHLYDLRKDAYVRMAQKADTYFFDIEDIPYEKDSVAGKKLDRDSLVVGRITREINVVGSDDASSAAERLYKRLDDVQPAEPKAQLKQDLAAIQSAFDVFIDTARADVAKISR
jgi:hypothetical protein